MTVAEVAPALEPFVGGQIIQVSGVDAEPGRDLGEGGQLVSACALALVEVAQVERDQIGFVGPRDSPAAVARDRDIEDRVAPGRPSRLPD